RFRPEVTVGIYLHFDAAIAEDALRHHGDHVDTVNFRRHDEGRGSVIGISGASADCGHKYARLVHDLAVPIAGGLERHQPSAVRYCSLQNDMRIDAHQLAVVICITIARACCAGLDVTHHRAGIAADLVVSRSWFSQHEQAHRLRHTVGRIHWSDACKRSLGGLDRISAQIAGASRSYTNDVARPAEDCQAALPSEKAALRNNSSKASLVCSQIQSGP